jgi:hypothetical protein
VGVLIVPVQQLQPGTEASFAIVVNKVSVIVVVEAP